MSVYCQQCSRERTEEDAKAKTPCPDCGSTKFHYVIHVETGRYHLEKQAATVEIGRALEVARWETIFKINEFSRTRTVCEGSVKPIPDIPPEHKIDIQAIAQHVYEERRGFREWKKPHVWVSLALSGIVVVIAAISLFRTL